MQHRSVVLHDDVEAIAALGLDLVCNTPPAVRIAWASCVLRVLHDCCHDVVMAARDRAKLSSSSSAVVSVSSSSSLSSATRWTDPHAVQVEYALLRAALRAPLQSAHRFLSVWGGGATAHPVEILRTLGVCLEVALWKDIDMQRATRAMTSWATEALARGQLFSPSVLALSASSTSFTAAGACLLYTSPSPRDRG